MAQTITFFNKVCLLLALTLVVPVITQGSEEETRKITKSYSVKPDAAVDIHNKYGEIKLETWDKDSVRIEVELRAIAGT